MLDERGALLAEHGVPRRGWHLPHAVEDADVHLAVEQLESPASGYLRLVHRRVGVA